MKTIFLIAILLVTAMSTVEAVTSKIEWTASPFDQKIFIENNGQFDGRCGNALPKILYGTSTGGVDLYFSKEGLTYKHDEYVAMREAESEVLARTETREYSTEEKEGMVKTMPHYLFMEWVGANPAVEIIADEPVTFYYTYAAENGTIIAHAYKKVIYKNLYPNIDVEYVLPEGKEGMKYTIIVRPGGDVFQIKMRYGGANRLERNDSGNVTIESSFGDFIDHAPVTSGNGLTTPSSFVIQGNEISFAVARYDKTEALIIDPWIINPTFAGYNAAYDVNYDHEGNVYAYGSFAPLKLAKFNRLGQVQWIFAATDFGKKSDTLYYYYGDFAVDEVTGTSYLVEGFNPTITGARILKVNTLGLQTGISVGDWRMREMWRVEYNRCTNKLVIGGGGTTGPNSAAMLDTNLVDFTPVNIFSANGCCRDIVLLAFDNESNFCFMAAARTRIGSSDELLIKCPVPNLLPSAFSVKHEHEFLEGGSITYINGVDTKFGRASNSMNGIAVSSNWLYTYDSDSLKRWNKNTGALVATRDISPSAPFYITYVGRRGTQIRWGGLAASDCDNLYIGLEKTIMEYDSSLTPRDTVALPDRVYDVKLWPNNKLYACGKGFVTQLDVQQSKLAFTTTMPVGCDSCGGTATASIQTCSNNPTGFSYSWNTNPRQTTQTATGLCPGTYTVTVARNCSVNFIDSVIIDNAINLKPVIITTGKRPGEEILIPIFLTPSTKLTTAKEIEVAVKYDPALLRFVNVKSSVGTMSKVKSLNGELTFTVSSSSPLPTPNATIAELSMQALLAPYSEGEIEVTQSKITLESGEQITVGNCPTTFSLDSSCVMPHDVRKRPSAEITGLYPNPSRNNVTMEVYAENDPDVRIEVYDVFGRQIETVFSGPLENGKNNILIVTESFSNGIYFCRLVNGFKMITKAFNVQR